MSTWNSTLWGSALPGGPAQSNGVVLVGDILYAAMRIAGILAAPGRGYGVDEKNDALNAFNVMLDGWNTERLTVYVMVRSLFTFTPSKQAYTIGPGGDFDMVRPIRIHAAGVLITTTGQPIELAMSSLTTDRWQGIAVKSTTSTWPSAFYYEPYFPLGTLNFWPIPRDVNQLVLYTEQQIGQFFDPSQQVLVPPGYLKALEYNLALELSVRFPRAKMTALAMQIAVDSKADIKRRNIPIVELKCDAGVLGLRTPTFNWLSGE